MALKETYPNDIYKFFAAVYVFFNSNKDARPEILIQYALMAFTVLIWMIGFIKLIVAIMIYLPLLNRIRGNLKEYCCHKIDKRIEEILRKKSRKRTEMARLAELEELQRNPNMQRNTYQPWYLFF